MGAKFGFLACTRLVGFTNTRRRALRMPRMLRSPVSVKILDSPVAGSAARTSSRETSRGDRQRRAHVRIAGSALRSCVLVVRSSRGWRRGAVALPLRITLNHTRSSSCITAGMSAICAVNQPTIAGSRSCSKKPGAGEDVGQLPAVPLGVHVDVMVQVDGELVIAWRREPETASRVHVSRPVKQGLVPVRHGLNCANVWGFRALAVGRVHAVAGEHVGREQLVSVADCVLDPVPPVVADQVGALATARKAVAVAVQRDASVPACRRRYDWRCSDEDE